MWVRNGRVCGVSWFWCQRHQRLIGVFRRPAHSRRTMEFRHPYFARYRGVYHQSCNRSLSEL